MRNPITITLSYSARMLIAANGSTPPTNYRIDAHDAVPAYVADHVDSCGISAVTVTADDIQAHGGSVTRAAVGILTDAATEPAATEPPTADDVTRAYDTLVMAVYLYEYRTNEQNRAKANRAQHALSGVLARRGTDYETRKMFTDHATSEGRFASVCKHARPPARPPARTPARPHVSRLSRPIS